MMQFSVVMFSDLSRVVESHTYDLLDMTLSEFLAAEVKNYDAAKPVYFSVYADGVKIPSELWATFNLKSCKSLKIVLEPLGDPFTWVAIVVAIAAAAYSAYLMHKMTAKTGTSTKTGSSIYDVNAQGNQVKLNEVIPEQFGLIKRFPDYIADTHRFYKNNKRILDLSLSQGVGSFSHTDNGSDMYFGHTPFNLLSEKIKYKVFEPAEPLAENSIDSELGWCWFNSLEISASGKELDTPKQNTDDTELIWCFSDFVLVMDSETRLFKDKRWTEGDILKILAPSKVVLFGDSMQYRVDEWVYLNSQPLNNYETKIKDDIASNTARANYLWGPNHKILLGLITTEAAADPVHSTYGLISGDHYNDSGSGHMSYYDNNDFCDCWGIGYINNDTYCNAYYFIGFEASAFNLPDNSWPNSKAFAALWDQITDPSTNNLNTNGITVRCRYGYQYRHNTGDRLYGAYILDTYVEFKAQLALWDYAPSYGSPGRSSQFWRRDDTNATSGENLVSVKNDWLARTNFSTYALFDRVGAVLDENSRPYIKIPYGYSDYDDVPGSLSYYTYAFQTYIQLPHREEGFYRVVEVKEINGANVNYFYAFWGSNYYIPQEYDSPEKRKFKAYIVKKCDENGNIDPNWRTFRNSYTCNLGGDIVKDDETREEGFNISVFDHVNA